MCILFMVPALLPGLLPGLLLDSCCLDGLPSLSGVCTLFLSRLDLSAVWCPSNQDLLLLAWVSLSVHKSGLGLTVWRCLGTLFSPLAKCACPLDSS